MHTAYVRINNVSAFISSCMMALLAAVALSSFLLVREPKGRLEVGAINVFSGNTRRYMNKKQDVAILNFNISADLSPLFHWNTKQVFLYVQAEYTNAQGVKNEVVIWDKIVRSKEEAKLALSGRNKYLFRNLGSSFKNVSPAHYSLKYNVMPYVGVLTYGEAARTLEPLSFPAKRSEVA